MLNIDGLIIMYNIFVRDISCHNLKKKKNCMFPATEPIVKADIAQCCIILCDTTCLINQNLFLKQIFWRSGANIS